MRAFVCLLLLSGCDAACDPAAIQRRLDDAAPGDVVLLEACTIDGELTVPAGVTLRGVEGTRVISDGRAITIEPGAPTVVERIAIESTGCAGIVATGAGVVELRDVTVRAQSGVGIAIAEVDQLVMERVTTIGPITSDNADTIEPPLPPFSCSATATHGIVIVGVGGATLNDVSADGFGAFGVLAIRSTTEWSGGGARGNLGAGVEIWDGEASLAELAIESTSDGAGAIEAYGLVAGGGAVLATTDLAVIDGDGFGIFHDGASAVHDALTVTGQGFAGVWMQGLGTVELRGASMLSDNTFAGVAGVGADDVTISGAQIERTAESVRLSGVRTIRAGDGIHLVDTDALVEGVMLRANTRVGALVDLGGGASARAVLSDVTVEASGTALGAIVQNGTIASDWDDGVTRAGDAMANDAAFTGELDVAGAVGPVCFPPLDELDTAGIDALIGP
jgi:hypothetical protein